MKLALTVSGFGISLLSWAILLWVLHHSGLTISRHSSWKEPRASQPHASSLAKVSLAREQVEDKVFNLEYVPTLSMKTTVLQSHLTRCTHKGVLTFRAYLSTCFVKWECCSQILLIVLH